MSFHPLRLTPGQDLRSALGKFLVQRKLAAAFVVAGIGSLSQASVRFADRHEPTRIEGPLEILTLSGSLSLDGPHLHICLSDAEGRVLGGHLGAGSIVRTTAEILLAPLTNFQFTRAPDTETGFRELVVTGTSS